MIGGRSIPRVYTELDDNTLAQLEEAAEKKGISKRQLVCDAVDHFLHYKEPDLSEIDQLRSELDKARSERDQARLEADQRVSEINRLMGEISQHKDGLEKARSEVSQFAIAQDKLKSDVNLARDEAEGLRRELEHSEGVIKLKNEEIAFLRSHVHQLSDKIRPALPPGEEEAKAKKWWQFW